MRIHMATIDFASGYVGGGMGRRVLGVIAVLCVAALSHPVLAGEGMRDGAKKVGVGVREVGKSAGHHGKKAGNATRDAAKETGRAAGKALNDVGKGLRKVFK